MVYSRARCIFTTLAVLVVAGTVPASSIAAEGQSCKGQAVPRSFEIPGTAPAGIFTSGKFVILIDDAATERGILACQADQKGTFRLIKRWPLPSTFSVQAMTLRGDQLVLVSTDGQKLEQNINPAAASKEAASGSRTASVDGEVFTEVRSANGMIALNVPMRSSDKEAPSRGDLHFNLQPILAGSKIFTRKVLAIDTQAGTATVFWDEVGQGTRAFVARIDRSGAIVAGAEVPLEKIETISERFVGVLSDGRAYYLKVSGRQCEPVLLPLDPDFASKSKPGGTILEGIEKRSKERKEGQSNDALKAASAERTARQSQALAAGDVASQLFDKRFQEAVRKLNGEDKRKQKRQHRSSLERRSLLAPRLTVRSNGSLHLDPINTRGLEISATHKRNTAPAFLSRRQVRQRSGWRSLLLGMQQLHRAVFKPGRQGDASRGP